MQDQTLAELRKSYPELGDSLVEMLNRMVELGLARKISPDLTEFLTARYKEA